MTLTLVTEPVAEFIAYFDCPRCNGSGEIGTSQDYFGNWNTKTCRHCDGTGEVEHLDPRDEDEPAEDVAA
jgi:DnaJ-class molecular chaperone